MRVYGIESVVTTRGSKELIYTRHSGSGTKFEKKFRHVAMTIGRSFSRCALGVIAESPALHSNSVKYVNLRETDYL